MSKPICTVMVGLPALGKSTLIDGIYKPDTWIYSTDMYIDEQARFTGKTYNEVFKDYIGKATTRMNALLDIAINDKIDVIWDQTNLGVGKRSKIVNRMRQAGYQVCCICITPPEPAHIDDLKTWKLRLNSRPGKTIPDHVLSNMWESYVEPSIDEGFDSIAYYNMQGALLAVDYGDN